jgi:hypothetical protein
LVPSLIHTGLKSKRYQSNPALVKLIKNSMLTFSIPGLICSHLGQIPDIRVRLIWWQPV